jgi:hypothetical protein
MDPVNYQVARMMRWHERAVNAVAVLLALLLLFLVLGFVVAMFASSANSGRSLDLLSVLVLGPIGVMIILAAGWLLICWAVMSWRVFRAGQVGFSVLAGAGYAFLALVALPFCGAVIGPAGVVVFGLAGLFAIPHMVRSDIRRLRETVLDSADLVGPGWHEPVQPMAAPTVSPTGIRR